MIRPQFSALALACAFGAPLAAHASGFQINQADARAIALSYAGVASMTGDVGFLSYSPAALRGLEGVQGTLGVVVLSPTSDYSNAEATVLGGLVPVSGATGGDDATPTVTIPTAAFGARLSDKIAVGFSLHTPFGLTTEYDPSWVGRYQGVDSEIVSVAGTFSASYDIHPLVTVAAGLRVQYLDAEFTNAVDAGSIAAAPPISSPSAVPTGEDVFASATGDDIGFGFVFGVAAEPMERLRIGVSYVSEISHDLEGSATFDLNGSASGAALQSFGLLVNSDVTSPIDTPATLALSADMDLTPRTLVAASIRRTFWSSVDEVRIDFDNPFQPDDVLTLNYEDQWAFSVGVEQTFTERFTGRFGVMRDLTPVDSAFGTPRVPDESRWTISGGLGARLGERFGVDASIAYLKLDDADIAVDGTLPENAARGSLSLDSQTDALIGALRFTARFN
ncbi:MAG: OmpP1/FadL family transporter [Pseudomonadota bacterium]